jgi:hypothetical protein
VSSPENLVEFLLGNDPVSPHITELRLQFAQTVCSMFKVNDARKLGIRLWIMMRDQIDYEEFCRRGKLRQKGESPCGYA